MVQKWLQDQGAVIFAYEYILKSFLMLWYGNYILY